MDAGSYLMLARRINHILPLSDLPSYHPLRYKPPRLLYLFRYSGLKFTYSMHGELMEMACMVSDITRILEIRLPYITHVYIPYPDFLITALICCQIVNAHLSSQGLSKPRDLVASLQPVLMGMTCLLMSPLHQHPRPHQSMQRMSWRMWYY